MHIRVARPGEHRLLTEIARQAKAHWGYGSAELAAWRPELTVSRESVHGRPTFVAETEDGTVLAFCQLSVDGERAVLEHLWVQPTALRRGLGRALLARAIEHARNGGARVLCIDADPHAEPFYAACGAVRVGTVAAPVAGDPGRVRPQLELTLSR